MGALTLSQVTKSFGKTDVIKGVDLNVDEGEFCVFVGPSGCGKSTLLRMIAGLEDVTSGEVALDGVRINDLPPARREIAMVFQSYALYPHLSVRDNMGLASKQAGVAKAEIAQATDRAGAMLALDALMERRPAELSGGQRQRVAIGRAIVRTPKLFLFDEPLSNLDAALRVQTRIEIARLHRELGATMIYVTHDQVEAMTLADRIAVLRDGRLEQVGTPAELYERPNSVFVAGFIGSPKMNFLTGEFAHAFDCSTLGIRPEHIDIVPEGTGMWSGEVVHAEDLGSDNFLFLDIGADEPVLVRQPGKLGTELGSRLTIRPRDGHLHRFDANDAPIR